MLTAIQVTETPGEIKGKALKLCLYSSSHLKAAAVNRLKSITHPHIIIIYM